MKKVCSLLLAVMLVMSLAVPAMAAEGQITYQGKSKILITPTATSYTDTDMFDNFKGVMPGDVLREEVKITNLAVDCDYVKVYVQAIPHGVTNQPGKKVLEAGETTASMKDFLNQLTLKVTCGDDKIFEGSPANGSDKIYLGSLRRYKALTLDAELTVPVTMGNEFANREGEVDWEFTFEAYNDPAGTSPKTGDYIMTAVAVMALSGAALLAVLFLKRKKRK